MSSQGEPGLAAVALATQLLTSICYSRAHTAGWWQVAGKDIREAEPYILKLWVGTKLALVHSEVSEGLEGYRKDRADEHLPQFDSFSVELADAIIRICDLAGGLGLPLGEALVAKLAYNAQRPDHKLEARAAAGGKAF